MKNRDTQIRHTGSHFCRVRLFIAVLIAAALSLLGCTSKQTAVECGIADQELYIANQTEPQDLDPHIVTGVPEFHILEALFEGLVISEPKSLQPVPGVAKSWDTADGGLTWTFHLRSDALWSNGDRVTAGDFHFSFQRILSPGLGSEYAYMLYCLKGAEAYHKRTTDDFSSVGAGVADDTTLVLTLGRPTPFFLSLLAHHSWFPVHRATILKFGKIDSRGTAWTRPEHFVGNGSFTLASWEINRIVSVVKSEKYWDRNKVRLNRINFYPIDNLQTEERSFRTGEVHMTTNLAPARIEWYRTNNPEALRIDPYLGTYFYVVNVQRPPMDNPLIRRAMALSIDRKAIVEHILKGGQLPATCFTPPATGGYTADSALRFDTTEARKLLAEAGYGPGGKAFPPVEVLYNTSETHHTVAQAIQQMWKRYLGIEVTLVNQEWKVYLASKQQGGFSIARMGWIGDYNDPMTFLDMWVTGGGNNNTGWSDRRYDSLISVAAVASGRETRFGAFRSAEALLLEEMPVLPIYFYTNVYLLHPAVKGWYPNLLNIHNYKYVWLEK
ncbi:MAG: peptide ABC transporter substrate-binding protein [Chitinispirillaceae bacterium]|nr:peptide ABC transporter substrate-binding protein [Chitinispirillaceae bacterium]